MLLVSSDSDICFPKSDLKTASTAKNERDFSIASPPCGLKSSLAFNYLCVNVVSFVRLRYLLSEIRERTDEFRPSPVAFDEKFGCRESARSERRNVENQV